MASETSLRRALEGVHELRPWYTPVPVNRQEVIVYRQPWEILRQLEEQDEEHATANNMESQDLLEIPPPDPANESENPEDLPELLETFLQSNEQDRLDMIANHEYSNPQDRRALIANYENSNPRDRGAQIATRENSNPHFHDIPEIMRARRHAHPSRQTLVQEHGYLAPLIETTRSEMTDTDLLRQRISNMTHVVPRPARRESCTGLPLLRDNDTLSTQRFSVNRVFREIVDSLCVKLEEMQMLRSSRQTGHRFTHLVVEISDIVQELLHMLAWHIFPYHHELWTTVRGLHETFERLQRRFVLLQTTSADEVYGTHNGDLDAIDSPNTQMEQIGPAYEQQERREPTAEETLHSRPVDSIATSARFTFASRAERRGAISEAVPGPPDTAPIPNNAVDNTDETPAPLVIRYVCPVRELLQEVPLTPQVRTGRIIRSHFSGGTLVTYSIGDTSNGTSLLARFDWGNRLVGVPHRRRNRGRGPAAVASGTLIYVETGLRYGLEMVRFDQIVLVEIERAIGLGLITEDLGCQLWVSWCGNGREVMGFGDVDDRD